MEERSLAMSEPENEQSEMQQVEQAYLEALQRRRAMQERYHKETVLPAMLSKKAAKPKLRKVHA
jgi:hypothetical protein